MSAKNKFKEKHPKIIKIPYNKKPRELEIKDWQILLRKQFGQKQNFEIRNTGDHPVFF